MIHVAKNAQLDYEPIPKLEKMQQSKGEFSNSVRPEYFCRPFIPSFITLCWGPHVKWNEMWGKSRVFKNTQGERSQKKLSYCFLNRFWFRDRLLFSSISVIILNGCCGKSIERIDRNPFYVYKIAHRNPFTFTSLNLSFSFQF